MPDIITVQIPSENGDEENPFKELIVEIINKAIVKPFLGGFKNLKTNIEYHHAFTQTGPAIEKIKFDNIISRDCQTVELKNKSNDTNITRSTQAFGDASQNLYLSDKSDYEIQAQDYETHEEMEARQEKLKKILIIQRNFRSYMIRKMIKERAAEYRSLLEEQKRRQNMIEEVYVNRFKKECVIKILPKTKEDFDMLYAQVQKWKEKEIQRISEYHSGGPKIAALNCLLDNEITLLNGIEKQKFMIREQAKEYRDQKFLKELGKPKQWIGYNGKYFIHILTNLLKKTHNIAFNVSDTITTMDTLRTQHVRRLTEYHKNLKTCIKKEERFQLLQKLELELDSELCQKLVSEVRFN